MKRVWTQLDPTLATVAQGILESQEIVKVSIFNGFCFF